MRIRVAVAVSTILLLCAGVSPAHTQMAKVGNSSIDGSRLRPFSANWISYRLVGGQRQRGATIHERLEATTRDGRKIWRRVQTINAPGGREIETTVEMDRQTLAPVGLRHTKTGQFPDGVVQNLSVSYTAGLTVGEATVVGGKTDSIPPLGMGSDGFETDVMGLVLASLPLADGYRAELPSVYAQLGETFLIRPHVTGTHDFQDAYGNAVTAWRVEVEWLNLRTDDIYVAGDEGSGGTYYVVTDPPEGFPFVPRYVNENTDIIVTFSNSSR